MPSYRWRERCDVEETIEVVLVGLHLPAMEESWLPKDMVAIQVCRQGEEIGLWYIRRSFGANQIQA